LFIKNNYKSTRETGLFNEWFLGDIINS